MKKIGIYITLLVSLYSSFSSCTLPDDQNRYKIDENYKYFMHDSLTHFVVKDHKTEEAFALNGVRGQIHSMIIKAGYVICSAIFMSRSFDLETGYSFSTRKDTIYIWDLEKKYRLCGLHHLLRKKTGIDFNHIIGLNPTQKIPCDGNIESMTLSDDYQCLIAKSCAILAIPEQMRLRFKKSDRTRSYNILRKEN